MISLQAALSAADELPDRVAIVAQDTSLTRQQFADQASALAESLLRQAPASAADVPAAVVAAAPSAQFAVAVTALGAAGYLWVGVEPSADEARIRAQAAQVGPTIVVVDSEYSPVAAAALRNTAGSAPAPFVLDLAELRAVAAPTGGAAAAAQLPAQRPIQVTLGFTSGTTGAPKLFRRRTNGRNQRVDMLRTLDIGSEDVYLSSASLAHPAGYVWAQAAMAVGATLVISNPDAASVLAALSDTKATVTYLSPPLLDRVLAEADRVPDLPLDTLRVLLTGGRHVSRRTVAQSRSRLGEVLHVYYATSETGIATIAGPEDLIADPLGAGRALTEMTVLVVDPETRLPRPTGVTGLIAIAGPYTADGQELIRHGGREHVLTSDYGVLDHDGRLTVLGRRDGGGDGELLDIPALESELKELVGVADGALVTGFDPASDRVAALVEADGEEPPDIEAVAAWLRAALSGSGRESTVVLLPNIPYNHAGKVDVRLARVAAGTETGR